MEHDEVFALYVEQASQVATEHLEEEAYKRAVEGTQKAVYQGGELVGYHTETSDTLLIFLLKARAPEKYRDRYEPPAGRGEGGPLRVIFETVDDRPVPSSTGSGGAAGRGGMSQNHPVSAGAGRL